MIFNDFGNANIVKLLDKSISKSEDLLVILPYEFSELQKVNFYYQKVIQYFDSLFTTLQVSVKKMMKKKKGTIVALINPQIFEGGNNNYNPVVSYALEALMKSLSKELNPFHINVFSIILAEEKNKEYKQKYYKTKLSDLVALHYKGLDCRKQEEAINYFIKNADLLNGQTITVGCNIGLRK